MIGCWWSREGKGREGKEMIEVNEEHEEEFRVGEDEQVSPFAKCSVTNKHTGP